ncbi:MAG: hypothetical protein ABL959_20425, partial [Pyrinomonadaceae bacterium]
MVRSLLILACLFVFSWAVTAQKALDKPVDKWSKDDAMEILNSSPWAKTYTSIAGAAAASQADALQSQSAT